MWVWVRCRGFGFRAQSLSFVALWLAGTWVVRKIRVPFWGPVHKGAVLLLGPRKGTLVYKTTYIPKPFDVTAVVFKLDSFFVGSGPLIRQHGSQKHSVRTNR